MFTRKTLEEKKRWLIYFGFDNFERIEKDPKLLIESIQISKDQKYIFVCNL